MQNKGVLNLNRIKGHDLFLVDHKEQGDNAGEQDGDHRDHRPTAGLQK